MNLSRVDLNLFTVFDAIYREGGITPASRKLHLSQPAVSHALARLRELLGDPLFERRGNEMIATPKARAFAATIGSSLHSLEQLLKGTERFDPAVSKRVFTIAARAANEGSFLPPIVADLACNAPGIDVAAVRINRRGMPSDLQSGALDLALDVALSLPTQVRCESLGKSPLAVLVRQGHPLVGESLDLQTYLSLEHVLVTGRRHGAGYEDAALARQGHTRRIRLRCQHHEAATEAVSCSDLALTLTRRHAELLNRSATNRLLPFPLTVPALELFMYWHENVENDAANQWLRGRIRAVIGMG